MSIIEIISRYFLPAALGAVAGFFSPWFKYWLQALTGRRSDRRALINKWQTELLEPSLYFDYTSDQNLHSGNIKVTSEFGMVAPDESYRRLLRTTTFATMQPYLSKQAIESLQPYKKDRTVHVMVGGSDNPVRKIIAGEIHRIEKSWGLI